MAEIIDQMGVASMKAQGMIKPITTAEKLRNSEHILYLFVDTEANKYAFILIFLIVNTIILGEFDNVTFLFLISVCNNIFLISRVYKFMLDIFML